MKEASLEMQRVARGRIARRNYQQMLSAIFVQARWRTFAAKRTYARTRNASIVLQVCRGCSASANVILVGQLIFVVLATGWLEAEVACQPEGQTADGW